MNKISTLAIAMAVAHAAHAADEPMAAASTAAAAPVAGAASTPAAAFANADFCLYAGSPPSDFKYRSIGHVKISKGTYGGVRDELPAFVAQARASGADAIVSYNGAQRFGFWPWRFVRPVLKGIAVKFDDGRVPDCAGSGGSTLAAIMASNVEPARK